MNELDNFISLSMTIFSGLLLNSSDDVISDSKSNEKVAETWSRSGIPVQCKCWPHSTHVMHYRNHPLDYEHELDQFLSNLRLQFKHNIK